MVAYDCVLDQPGCVNVAAGMGADTTVPQLFPNKSWLLAPTPDMRVYETTPEQLALLAERLVTRFGPV